MASSAHEAAPPGADDRRRLLEQAAEDERRRLQRWVTGAALASAGLLSASVAGALYVVDVLTRATAVDELTVQGFTPYEIGVPWENVRIPTADGTLLSGWWLPRPESDRVVVGCHGYRGRKADLLGIGAAFWRGNYNVLLFDYRGHGEHAGTRITLGYREVEDALAAVRFSGARMPDRRHIGVIGYSMGAAVALMAAAREPSIEAVVADSSFATQRNPVDLRMRQTLHTSAFGRPVLFFADQWLRWLFGYRFRDVEPLREVGRIAPRPLLLIHGTADTIIDAQDSQRLFAAAGDPKELWLLPGVGHCGAYFADRPAYVERVGRFFEAAFDEPKPARRQAG